MNWINTPPLKAILIKGFFAFIIFLRCRSCLFYVRYSSCLRRCYAHKPHTHVIRRLVLLLTASVPQQPLRGIYPLTKYRSFLLLASMMLCNSKQCQVRKQERKREREREGERNRERDMEQVIPSFFI